MQDARHIGQVLPPGMAPFLPVINRACTGCDPGLSALVRVCLGTLRHFLQCPPGLLESLFGLAQTTEDGQCIAFGQVMAQVTRAILLATATQALFTPIRVTSCRIHALL